MRRLHSANTTSRSEEHTSELQSRFDLVCRLLLEKKIHVLQSGDGPRELPLRLGLGTFEADAPTELGEGVEGNEVGEVVVEGARPLGERNAGGDQRRREL